MNEGRCLGPGGGLRATNAAWAVGIRRLSSTSIFKTAFGRVLGSAAQLSARDDRRMVAIGVLIYGNL